MKIKNKEEIKKVLFISLSNIGDIILTTPVLSVLRREFPDAQIDVLAGPSGREIFSGHPYVANFIIYDKAAKLIVKRKLIRNLRDNRYDLIVDLRNSLFPFLIGSRYRTPIIKPSRKQPVHKKDAHLRRLKALGLNVEAAPFTFYVDEREKAYMEKMLREIGIKKDFVVISPAAKSHIKRWTKEGFAALCDRLIGELGMDVIMTGDDQDRKIVSEIAALMKNKAVDFSGKLTLRQLGAILGRSKLLITNDSAPMHIAYALGTRVLAIFGPTDPEKYGPKGRHDVIIRKELACSPCEVAQCKKMHECMNFISTDEVFEAARKILK